MVALARGEENTQAKLNFFITVNGVLTDAAEIGFQIFDVAGGFPGTQIFPATAGDFEPVETGPGHFSIGSYYAFDNGAGVGWTPSLAEPIGTHLIKWRWKITAAAPAQLGQEEFEVLVQSAGSTTDTYITVQDIRDLGMPDPPTDAEILAQIQICQAFIDRATRQWFVARALQFKFDGTDSDTIHLGIPIISIEFLRINDAGSDLDPDLFRVYSGRSYPDDRKNPRIKLVRSHRRRDIFTAPLTLGDLKFRKGRQNQEVKGLFGYVEDNGETPGLIKEAMKRLVVEKLASPIFSAPGASPPPAPPPSAGGVVVEERTDGHSIRFATASLGEKRPGLSGFTQDQKVLDIIKLFKGPIGVATPAHWSYD